MLRTTADVRERQLLQQGADASLGIVNTKAIFDHFFQVDPPPAHHAMDRPVGTGSNNLFEFLQLGVSQTTTATGAVAIDKSVRPFLVETQDPVAQCLPIHAADASRILTVHAVIGRREREQASRLTPIATSLCQTPEGFCVKVPAQ